MPESSRRKIVSLRNVLLVLWVSSGVATVIFGGLLKMQEVAYILYMPYIGLAGWWMALSFRQRPKATQQSRRRAVFSRATPAYLASAVLGLVLVAVSAGQYLPALLVLGPLAIVSVLTVVGAFRLRDASDEMYWKGTEAARQLTVAWAVLILWSGAGLLKHPQGADSSLVNAVVGFILFGVVILAAGSGWSNHVAARASLGHEAEAVDRRRAAAAAIRRHSRPAPALRR